MLEGQILWAIIGIGVILLGVLMAYATLKRRRGGPAADRASEEKTRELYREENR